MTIQSDHQDGDKRENVAKPPISQHEQVELSCWISGRSGEFELDVKCRAMLKIKFESAARNQLAIAHFLDRIVNGEFVELVNKGDDRKFIIIELPLQYFDRFLYVSMAANKSCALLLSHKKDHNEAIRRALIWISKCPKRFEYGQPKVIPWSRFE